MASEERSNSMVLDPSSTAHVKNFDNSSIDGNDNTAESSSDLNNQRQCQYGNKSDKERKIGHRRVGEGGQITYKKIQTTQIMGSIQLGIQHTVGSLASKPKRDLLMMDFWEIESITFPPEGSTLTPAHHYSEFRYKIYAPIAFRYFRDLFGIQPDDFMMSMCSSPLRELSNPGASGSIFYLTNDDEFIIKTVQHKEGEFLQKLLPGYYMNLNQNPRTLLPKFFGLYCLQTNNSKNIRLVVMNNLLPSYVKMHLKYDLKGSTFKRKASKVERSKNSPTYKDLDFMEHHPNGILLEAETYNALIKTIQRDCTVLESFKIMDYSLLVGVHNLDLSTNEKQTESKKENKSCKQIPNSYEYDLEDAPEADQYLIEGRDHDVAIWNRNRSVNRHRLVAHSTAMESIQAESEPIDDEEDVPPGGIPARSEKGERLLLFVGIIDILQSYRLKKKLEHTFKSIIHDGDTVSVCRPSFYAQRFQNFMAKTVFRKIPSLDLPEIKGNHRKFRTLVSSYIALKHSPSKRKSLSKAIQRSLECDLEYRNPPNTSQFLHASGTQNYKVASQSKTSTKFHAASSINSSSIQNSSKTSTALKQMPSLGSVSSTTKTKIPPPVPPRNSPRSKNDNRLPDKEKFQSHRGTTSSGIYSESKSGETFPLSNSLKVPKTNDIPRFGEQRSPSNVRDWLELHDLFTDEDDLHTSNQTHQKPLQYNKQRKIHKTTRSQTKYSSVENTDSLCSVRSNNCSDMKHRSPSVDIYYKQNSIMSYRAPPSVVSLVSYFPALPTETRAMVESPQRKQKRKRGTILSCSSTPPPAFDEISGENLNKISAEHKLHPHCEPKMYVGPGFRRSPMHDTLSVSEVHLDTNLAVDTSYNNQYGSGGGLAWTPPTSGDGSTPTWTEGTPSFTDSSSSDDFEIHTSNNVSRIDRYKLTVEDAISSLTSEVVH